jgi:hypothetical protein
MRFLADSYLHAVAPILVRNDSPLQHSNGVDAADRQCEVRMPSDQSCADARAQYEHKVDGMDPCYQYNAVDPTYSGAKTLSKERINIQGACP